MKFSSFVRLCQLIKNRLLKIEEAINAYPTGVELNATQVQKLLAYVDEVGRKQNDLEKHITNLLNVTTISDDIDDQLMNDLTNDVQELKITITSKISVLIPNEKVEPTNINVSTAPVATTRSTVRLPKIELKTFNGDVHSWVTFINLFDTLINSNCNITPVEKHQYLVSALSGEALNLVKALQISAENYLIAYNTLRERYHSVRRLTAVHINKIIDLPSITGAATKPLRLFLDALNEQTHALAALNYDIVENNPLLFTLLLRKLDYQLRKRFEQQHDADQQSMPTVKQLIKFLNDECLHQENANLSLQTANPPVNVTTVTKPQRNSADNTKPVYSRNRISLLSTSAPSNSQCLYCKQNTHKIYSCPTFQQKSPNERIQFIRVTKSCLNCLGALHSLSACKSTRNCVKCNKRHHTLLHLDNYATSPRASKQETPNAQPNYGINSGVHNTPQPSCSTFVGISQTLATTLPHTTTVLLATTLVQLTTQSGQTHVFRGVIDSASQATIITENAAQLLNVSRVRLNTNIDGISLSHTQTKGLTYLDISTLSGNIISNSQPVIILNKITSPMPDTVISHEVVNAVKQYCLADPTFHLKGPIDILLGADIFPRLFNGEKYFLGPNLPCVMGSVFGFVIMGQALCIDEPPRLSSNITTLLSTTDIDLHTSLQRFWQLEEPPSHSKLTNEEQMCETHFVETHSRDNSGRYIVRLPFKEQRPPLGDSSTAALRRFNTLEKNLSAQPQLKTLYVDFMADYKNSGHMVKRSSVPTSNTEHFFLPHHGVLKESSTSTKLRVVFDASARTSNSISLNQILHPGPKLQNDICDVITHFRRHPVVFSTDIRQMYRQIVIHPDDQTYQLIYWRNEPSLPLNIYQLTTVTYGVNSAPFLALRTLKQLVVDEGHNFPLAKNALDSQIFVDDIICGANNVQDALTLQHELIQLLHKGGFELRKWTSNHPQVIAAVPSEHLETPLIFRTPEQPQYSILGLQWTPDSDDFSYRICITQRPPTKRNVLSAIAQVYDPCGWITPIIFWAKTLMQLLWTLGLQWDDTLPLEISNKWTQFLEDLPAVKQITVPRHIELATACNLQLHGFSDASEAGYGCCVYLRSLDAQDKVHISLLLAKSRVSPLKTSSIPRLELCAAHLLAKVIYYCNTLLAPYCNLNSTMAWTDSTIVLAWIHTPPYRLKTFVANRVSQIQEWTPPHLWNHVISAHNPADFASRGQKASLLVSNPLWWLGPTWLSQPQETWPASCFTPVTEDSLPETKPVPLNVLLTTSPQEDGNTLLTRYSSWSQLVRITAYVRRFIANCKTKTRLSGRLRPTELDSALGTICKMVQVSAFSEDLEKIRTNAPCSLKLRRLDPFVDDSGLLRVGGRLRHSTLQYSARHPILLPKKHHVVDLIIDAHHKRYLHAGTQLLQSLLNRSFWILSARNVIRSRIFKCITCFKCKPRTMYPKMGDLPSSRTTPSRAFLSCGVDYGGPFTVKIHTLRSAKQIKAYLCLFVCFTTKAVHLEVATDLSTEAYIAALTRFISRRGLCAHIYSDCGTNFIGASTHIKKIIRSFLSQETTTNALNAFAKQHSIEFHFIPPANPHHGGLWEAAIKSAKHHLIRVVGDQVLTLEEFITLTTRVEAMLNSRPLTPLSNDPNDWDMLTPGHFLIGGPLAALPEAQVEDVTLNRLRRWKLVQALSQRLWRRWQVEYLHTLQQRPKWTLAKKNLEVGDLVLIHEPHAPSLAWKTGRITKVFPGQDGTTRVVQLRTPKGELTRPVVKVSALPLN